MLNIIATLFNRVGSMSYANVSFDLDGVAELYDLAGKKGGVSEELFIEAVPRLLSLLKKYKIKSTFFVVGKYVKKEREVFKEIVEEGHEIGNHTLSHNHRFVELGAAEKREEILETHGLIKEHLGVEPLGFRLPKYRIDADTLSILEDLGYLYDSSIIPAYHPGKFPVKNFFAPNRPYYPSRGDILKPGSTGCYNVLEIPVSVSPFFRVPLGGTYNINLGLWWVRANASVFAWTGKPFVTNFHARDALDYLPEIGGLPSYIRRNKSGSLEFIEKTLMCLKNRFELVTLQELAGKFGVGPGSPPV